MDSPIIKTEKTSSLFENNLQLSRESKRRYFFGVFIAMPAFYVTILAFISTEMETFNQYSPFPFYFQSIFMLPGVISAFFAYRYSFFYQLMKTSVVFYLTTGFCTTSIYTLYTIFLHHPWFRSLVIFAALFFIFYTLDKFRRIDITPVYRKIKKFSLINYKAATYKLDVAEENCMDSVVDFKPFSQKKVVSLVINKVMFVILHVLAFFFMFAHMGPASGVLLSHSHSGQIMMGYMIGFGTYPLSFAGLRIFHRNCGGLMVLWKEQKRLGRWLRNV